MYCCRHFAYAREGGGDGVFDDIVVIWDRRCWVYSGPEAVEEEGIEYFEDDVHCLKEEDGTGAGS